MLNHLGLGLQFSAAAARIYELAKHGNWGESCPLSGFVRMNILSCKGVTSMLTQKPAEIR